MAADLRHLPLSPLLALAFLAPLFLALSFALLLRSCIAAAPACPLVGRHRSRMLLLLPLASTASPLFCLAPLLLSSSLGWAGLGCLLFSFGIPVPIPALGRRGAPCSASAVPALPTPGSGALAPRFGHNRRAPRAAWTLGPSLLLARRRHDPGHWSAPPGRLAAVDLVHEHDVRSPPQRSGLWCRTWQGSDPPDSLALGIGWRGHPGPDRLERVLKPHLLQPPSRSPVPFLLRGQEGRMPLHDLELLRHLPRIVC